MYWWFVWAVALLPLLRSPSALGASNFHLRNHTGALFLYAFDNGQVPTSPPSYVPDRLGLNLMGNLTTSTSGAVTWSAIQQGMSIPIATGNARAVSQSSSASTVSRLSTEFTLEFFISNPFNPRSQSLLIAGFGSWVPGEPFSPCDSSSPTEGGWRLSSSLGAGIDFEGVLEINGVPTCQSISVAIETDTPRHLVVRARHGTLSIVTHINSFSATDPSVRFSSSLWARNPAPLTIASPHPTSGWIGSMYLAAMYDRYLSNAEIATNRDLGPPNSLPTCATTTLTALEDGTSTLFP